MLLCVGDIDVVEVNKGARTKLLLITSLLIGVVTSAIGLCVLFKLYKNVFVIIIFFVAVHVALFDLFLSKLVNKVVKSQYVIVKFIEWP